MPKFTKTTVKKARRPKTKEPEYEDRPYDQIPGIIIFKNDTELYNWMVYGTKTAPKGEK